MTGALTLLLLAGALLSIAAPSILAASAGGATDDPEAAALATSVLEAHGGREAWEAVRLVSWINNGQRLYVWDKQTGAVRVENKITVVILDLETHRGRAWKYGQEITEPDTLARALDFAYEAFRVDAYEILAPFLLETSDAVLSYGGRGEIDGQPVERLELTFTGSEPYAGSAYRLSVDPETHRIVWWDYFLDAGDQKPSFSVPWGDYEWYDGILLSTDRGEKHHTHVTVLDSVPPGVFDSVEPVSWLRSELDEGDGTD